MAWKGNMVLGRRPASLREEYSDEQIVDHIAAAEQRIAELEAALRVQSNPAEYPDLAGFHGGVRSVYGQAVYEDRKEVAEWIASRYPAAVQVHEAQ